MIPTTGAESSTPTLDSSTEPSLERIEQAVKGDNPFLFRVAQATLDPTASLPSVRVDGPIERTAQELTDLEPEFSRHEQVTGQPFTASYLRLDKVYSHLEMTERSQLSHIEQYIKDQIPLQHLQDSASAAHQVLHQLESKLGLTPTHDPFYRLERMAQYLISLRDFDSQEELRKHLGAA